MTTISVSYIFLNDIKSAIKLGGIDMGIKFIIHYLYERGFSKIKWGYELTEVDTTD